MIVRRLDRRRHQKAQVALGLVTAKAVGERLTAALLDRLPHHCHIFEMNGESHRFRESVKKSKSGKQCPFDGMVERCIVCLRWVPIRRRCGSLLHADLHDRTLRPITRILQTVGIILAAAPTFSYTQRVVAQDGARVGTNSSAATTQGQGRRCTESASLCPLSCLWPNAKNPRDLGTERQDCSILLCRRIAR